MKTLAEQFKNARKYGVPLLAVETPDQGATIAELAAALNGKSKAALLAWDIVRGLGGINEDGRKEVQRLAPSEDKQMAMLNLTEMLMQLHGLAEGAVVFVQNAHRFWSNESVAQGIWNLRDPFKATSRMLILLAPAVQLPIELDRDVLVIDEALPGDDELGAIVDGVHKAAGVAAPKDKRKDEIVRAARGLAAFPAEQAVALSLTKDGTDIAALWSLKKKMIEQTRGLSIYGGGETFDDVGGIGRIKCFGSMLFGGVQPPSAVIFIDEIEKAMAGSSALGDTSGTSQDQLGVMLSAMQDNEWNGMILVGPPGCAKSLYAKALGATHKVPTIRLDLGSMKGSLVGQSEQQVRAAIKIVQAVAGKGAYWVATCNRLDSLPPELRRRFTDGIWFFDLPDQDERDAVWKIMRAHYQIPSAFNRPVDVDWTGADIRNVCSISKRLQINLIDAASFITPVAKSDPDSIDRLRRVADGAFLSASGEGVYHRCLGSQPSGRKFGGGS